MRHRLRLLAGALALSASAVGASAALADTYDSKIVGDSSTLTVDVVPLHAQVRLNGVPLGTAHDLVSRAIPLTPGRHVMVIEAPGYIPAQVDVAATVDWATRIWLQLIPDRK